jgi:predicted RNA-binding Zn ribbon-like protein
MAETAGGDGWELLGGHLALDFANTLEDRGTAGERERLTGFAALVDWALAAGAVDRRQAADLRAYADWAPGSAADALGRARALREAIYPVAAATAADAAPAPGDLAALNDALAPLMGATRLGATRLGATRLGATRLAATRLGGSPGGLAPGGLAPVWGGDPDALERVLWPVACAAFDLLSGAEAGRLRQCAGADCRRLFLDRSKNGSRRWCAMSDCGNLAKARRHRARVRDRAIGGNHAP